MATHKSNSKRDQQLISKWDQQAGSTARAMDSRRQAAGGRRQVAGGRRQAKAHLRLHAVDVDHVGAVIYQCGAPAHRAQLLLLPSTCETFDLRTSLIGSEAGQNARCFWLSKMHP